MLPRTVSQGYRVGSWNTTARSGPGAVTARPSTRTSPADAASKPATMLSTVVLPQPLGPSRQ